jgi:UDP-N-acetylglucosamine--N-acetylmuramyl-(pentapeptide) pyrophosphoryl-undecaprenol N-acetylglucosamine transferase
MKCVLATGGSGGHIIPAIKTGDFFKAQGHEVVFIGVFNSFISLINQPSANASGDKYSVYELNAIGLSSGSFTRKLVVVYRMLRSFFESIGLLRKIAPDVVVGFGSYAAFAVVLAAVVLRIPTIIHEQNACPGRANKMLSGFVKKIAVSYPESADVFPPGKIVLTGCPSRLPLSAVSAEKNLTRFGLKSAKTTVLILGGSQGSRRINQVFIEGVPLIQEQGDIQVIHICGQMDFEQVKMKYANSNIDHFVTAFLNDMEAAYSLADVALSRAGAVSLAELAAFGIPAVVIPYPYAGGHQLANARGSLKTQPIVIIEEKDLTGKNLTEGILAMLREKDTAKKNAAVRRDATRCLAEEILRLASK